MSLLLFDKQREDEKQQCLKRITTRQAKTISFAAAFLTSILQGKGKKEGQFTGFENCPKKSRIFAYQHSNLNAA